MAMGSSGAAESYLSLVCKPLTSYIVAHRPSMLTMLPCCITHIVMAGAEYEYCPFMFWYPPAVCYYKQFGPGSGGQDAGEAVAKPINDIQPYVADEAMENAANGPETSRLLSLPAEVRLRIYYWAYRMSPIQPKELAAGYPIPMLCRYVLHPLDPELEQQVEAEIENEQTMIDLATENKCLEGGEQTEGGKKDGGQRWEKMKAEQDRKKLTKDRVKERMRELNRTAPGLLSSDRPLAGVPTDLLLTCRQIYFEAREMPFANNEFVFLNWFSSGLNAAAAVVKAQRPWQRLAMRYSRLEIMAEDLARKAALSKWAELCGPGQSASWARGLRGLRLKIVGQVGRRNEDSKDEDEFVDGLEEAGGARRWVEGGRLAEMENLERLEIEIIKNSWGTAEKMAWCDAVQEALREKGSKAVVVGMGRIL